MRQKTALSRQLSRINAVENAISAVPSPVAAKNITSFAFDSKAASDIDLTTLWDLANESLNDLILLDPSFNDSKFIEDLFSKRFTTLDRSSLDSEENHRLNNVVADFLHVLSPYFLLRSSHIVLDWLIRSLKINTMNSDPLIDAFIPYMETEDFSRLLKMCWIGEKSVWHFLINFKSNSLNRSVLIKYETTNFKIIPRIYALVTKFSLNSKKFSTYISFYTWLFIEYLQALHDNIDEVSTSKILHLIIPGFSASSIDFQLSNYLIFSQLCLKVCFTNSACTDILDQLIQGANEQCHYQCLLTANLIFASQEQIESINSETLEKLLSFKSVDSSLEKCFKSYNGKKFLTAISNSGFLKEHADSRVSQLFEKLNIKAALDVSNPQAHLKNEKLKLQNDFYLNLQDPTSELFSDALSLLIKSLLASRDYIKFQYIPSLFSQFIDSGFIHKIQATLKYIPPSLDRKPILKSLLKLIERSRSKNSDIESYSSTIKEMNFSFEEILPYLFCSPEKRVNPIYSYYYSEPDPNNVSSEGFISFNLDVAKKCYHKLKSYDFLISLLSTESPTSAFNISLILCEAIKHDDALVNRLFFEIYEWKLEQPHNVTSKEDLFCKYFENSISKTDIWVMLMITIVECCQSQDVIMKLFTKLANKNLKISPILMDLIISNPNISLYPFFISFFNHEINEPTLIKALSLKMSKFSRTTTLNEEICAFLLVSLRSKNFTLKTQSLDVIHSNLCSNSFEDLFKQIVKNKREILINENALVSILNTWFASNKTIASNILSSINKSVLIPFLNNYSMLSSDLIINKALELLDEDANMKTLLRTINMESVVFIEQSQTLINKVIRLLENSAIRNELLEIIKPLFPSFSVKNQALIFNKLIHAMRFETSIRSFFHSMIVNPEVVSSHLVEFANLLKKFSSDPAKRSKNSESCLDIVLLESLLEIIVCNASTSHHSILIPLLNLVAYLLKSSDFNFSNYSKILLFEAILKTIERSQSLNEFMKADEFEILLESLSTWNSSMQVSSMILNCLVAFNNIHSKLPLPYLLNVLSFIAKGLSRGNSLVYSDEFLQTTIENLLLNRESDSLEILNILIKCFASIPSELRAKFFSFIIKSLGSASNLEVLLVLIAENSTSLTEAAYVSMLAELVDLFGSVQIQEQVFYSIIKNQLSKKGKKDELRCKRLLEYCHVLLNNSFKSESNYSDDSICCLNILLSSFENYENAIKISKKLIELFPENKFIEFFTDANFKCVSELILSRLCEAKKIESPKLFLELINFKCQDNLTICYKHLCSCVNDIGFLQDFAPVLVNISMADNDFFSAVACLIMKLKEKSFPHLNRILRNVFNNKNSSSSLDVFETILSINPNFLSPYANEIIDLLFSGTFSSKARISYLRKTVAERMESRVLYPAIFKSEFSESQFVPFIISVIAAASKEIIGENQKLSLTWIHKSLNSGNLKEQSLCEILKHMILKMNDVVFRPFWMSFYQHLSTAKDLSSLFLNVLVHLTDEFKDIFLPYFHMTFDIVTQALSEHRSIDAVFKLFKYEFDCNPKIFQQESFVSILEMLIDAMTSRTSPKDKLNNENYIACFGQMISSCPTESLTKLINSKILNCCKFNEVKIRLLSVAILKEFYNRKKEEFLVYLPETIPTLAELLEDDSDEVIKATRSLVKVIEEYLGEPIKKYF